MTLYHLNRLAKRGAKPRVDGLTMMIDTGMGVRMFHDYLELAGEYIDFIKLGFGTFSITPLPIIKEKLKLAQQYQISLYPGGTFFECFAIEQRAEYYFEQLCHLGFSWVEVSNGTIDLDRNARTSAIRAATAMGLQVISEIGKKQTGVTIPEHQLLEMYEEDIAEGASYVIVEGRETGEDIGVFNKEGEIDRMYVENIYQSNPQARFIWEAPKKSQQIAFIKLIGNSVNLGNIPYQEILSLESLRRGLRSDTFNQRVE